MTNEEKIYNVITDNEGYQNSAMVSYAIPMRDMRTIKTDHDAIHWVDTRFIGHPVNLLIEPEVDGLSIRIRYENEVISGIFTRGSGNEGTDITRVSTQIHNIPQTIKIPESFEVYGDVYISKSSTSVDEEFEFVAYDLADLPFTTEEEKLQFLREVNFKVVPYQIVQKAEDVIVMHEIFGTEGKQNLPYEIDGIIVKVNSIQHQLELEDNDPKKLNHAMVYKFAAERYQTTLQGIDWKTSESGRVTPIALIAPIEIENEIIERASLGSKRKLDLLQLEIGDVIEVGMAGDVSPHVYKNVTRNIENK